MAHGHKQNRAHTQDLFNYHTRGNCAMRAWRDLWRIYRHGAESQRDSSGQNRPRNDGFVVCAVMHLGRDRNDEYAVCPMMPSGCARPDNETHLQSRRFARDRLCFCGDLEGSRFCLPGFPSSNIIRHASLLPQRNGALHFPLGWASATLQKLRLGLPSVSTPSNSAKIGEKNRKARRLTLRYRHRQ